MPRVARKPTTSATQVAYALIRLASYDEHEDALTHLRLQKLLYYVQGWCLALKDRPMFGDRIEAWPLGPVVPNVWRKFKHHGSQVILDAPEADLTRSDVGFIAQVWNGYRHLSASRLTEMTHEEDPWKEARRGLSPVDRSNRPITLDSMKRFFDQIAEA